MAKKTRKWCESRICGRKVDVWLSNAEEAVALVTAEGAAHGPSGSIIIDDGLAQDGAEETLVHEELHLMFEYSGAQHVARQDLGITDDRWMQVEELIVRLLAPAILNSYRDMGRVKMPKRPRGHVAIELGDIVVKSRKARCSK